MYTTDVSSACVDTRVRVIKTKVRVIWSGGHIEVSTWSHYYGRSNSQDNRRAKPKGQLLPTRQKSHPISLKTWLVSKTLSPLSCIITMKETRPRQGASYLPSELSELITKLLGEKKNLLRRRLFLPQERELLDGWVKPLSTLAPTALPTATTPTSLLFCLSLRLPTRAHSQASIAWASSRQSAPSSRARTL